MSKSSLKEKKDNPFLELVSTIKTVDDKIIKIYERIADVTLAQMAESLSKSLSDLSFSTEQREKFCLEYPDQLSPHFTFFIEKEGSDCSFTAVGIDSEGLYCTNELDPNNTWYNYRRAKDRVVVYDN